MKVHSSAYGWAKQLARKSFVNLNWYKYLHLPKTIICPRGAVAIYINKSSTSGEQVASLFSGQ